MTCLILFSYYLALPRSRHQVPMYLPPLIPPSQQVACSFARPRAAAASQESRPLPRRRRRISLGVDPVPSSPAPSSPAPSSLLSSPRLKESKRAAWLSPPRPLPRRSLPRVPWLWLVVVPGSGSSWSLALARRGPWLWLVVVPGSGSSSLLAPLPTLCCQAFDLTGRLQSRSSWPSAVPHQVCAHSRCG